MEHHPIRPRVPDELREFGRIADIEESMPEDAVRLLADGGLLAPLIPRSFGGLGASYVDFGAVCEDLGAVCSSMRSLVTVQSMVAAAIDRWGTAEQRTQWLPRLSAGTVIAGFCLTEDAAGSDAAAVEAELGPAGGSWRLKGIKTWVTFGQVANLFLVIARSEQGPTAVLCDVSGPAEQGDLVRRAVHMRPLGLRGAMQADVEFDLALPTKAVLGKPGLGSSVIAQTALNVGRLSVAWGCVGMTRTCLEAASEHAIGRVQFGKVIAEHQLVQRLLARTLVGLDAARGLCGEASAAHDERRPDAIRRTVVAKYFASRTAISSAIDAVQILGARGCESGSPVERIYRDSKIMQIIEGSDEMAEIAIGSFAAQDARRRLRAGARGLS